MLFWYKHKDVAELQARLDRLIKDRDAIGESISNYKQAIATARSEADRMKLAYSEEGLNRIALTTARRIEDMFVSYPGGRDNRLKAVQAVLREVMRANLSGKTNWKGPAEPSYYKSPEKGDTE